jgi:hypothetical protein
VTVRATVRHAPVTEVVRPRLSIFIFAYGFLKSSGYIAMFTAIRRGSSRVSIWPSGGRPDSILEPDQPWEDQGRGMRAMGGAVKPPTRSCSKSRRICQIRPSTKPIAIATEIWKTITSNRATACSFPGQCHKVARAMVTEPFFT